MKVLLTGNVFVIFVAIIIFTSVGLQARAYAASWSSESDRLEHYIEATDKIVTGMVTDKEAFDTYEDVWISVYEWLKNGSSTASQIILKVEGPANSREMSLAIGEEVLLMVEEIDVSRGYFGLYHLDSDTPPKYPITLRNQVLSLVEELTKDKTQAQKEEEELQKLLSNSDSENCKILEVDMNSADKFLYCTYQEEEMRFYVPISVTLNHVKQELLKHVSEQYFSEHFNLKRAWDEAVVNGHAVPVGQRMEFEYTIGNFTLYYPVHIRLGFEEGDRHLLYLRYVPPREVTDIAIEDESQIEKIIYDSSCLPAGTPYVLDDGVALSHIDRGFSPFISGRGPPDVFDRFGNQIKEAEKRFQIWLETGEIQCTTSVKYDDEIDASIGRGQEVVLMNALAYLGNGGSEPPTSMENDGNSAGQALPLVGVGAAIAGVIAFFTLRKRMQK